MSKIDENNEASGEEEIVDDTESFSLTRRLLPSLSWPKSKRQKIAPTKTKLPKNSPKPINDSLIGREIQIPTRPKAYTPTAQRQQSSTVLIPPSKSIGPRKLDYQAANSRLTLTRGEDSWKFEKTVPGDSGPVSLKPATVTAHSEFTLDLLPSRRNGQTFSYVALKDFPGYTYHKNIINQADDKVVTLFGKKVYVQNLDGFTGPDGSIYSLARISLTNF
ncbi:MAG: hypothetical protein AB8G05_13615 [Oligoflexales bacterium]